MLSIQNNSDQQDSNKKRQKKKEWYEDLRQKIEKTDFRVQIKKRGYYLSPGSLLKESDKKFAGITASLLSIDFWEDQPKVLTESGYYLIRTGIGRYAILEQKSFPRSYVNLQIDKVNTELFSNEPLGFHTLKSAFDNNKQENSLLEQLRFYGIYDQIIATMRGKPQNFHSGVRGKVDSEFDVYLARSDSTIEKVLTHHGQVELDYSLWTEDSLFLFESKYFDNQKKYNIGWHKFAFAAAKFRNYPNLKIYPIYILANVKTVYLFAFPQFRFYSNGVILNDVRQLTPEYSFVVNLKH